VSWIKTAEIMRRTTAHKRNLVFAMPAAVLAINCSTATADVCEAVLKYAAFDINDSQVYGKFRQASYDALCRTVWKDLSDYQKRSGNLDTRGSYIDIFTGGTHGDALEDKQRYQEDFERLCQSRDSSVRDRFFKRNYKQDPKAALAAWSDCESGGFGLRAAIDLLLEISILR
jgi:hypothetical protein